MGKTIGDLIQSGRRSWGYSVKEFCQLAEISPATYNRLVKNETVVTIGTTRRIMSILAVTKTDLRQLTAVDVLSPTHLLQQLHDTVLLHPTEARLQAALADCEQRYQTTHNRGYALIAALLRVHQTGLDVHERIERADALLEEISRYRAWTTFEVLLFLHLVGASAFDKVATCCTRLLAAPNRAVTTYFAPLTEALLNRGLATKSQQSLAFASDWLAARPLTTDDAEPRACQQFAAIMGQSIANLTAAESAYEALQARLTTLGVAATTGLRKRFAAVWALRQSERLIFGEPVPTEPADPVAQPNSLSGWRQAKRIRIADLAQEVGVSYATYHRLEANEPMVGADILARALNYLQITFDDIDFFSGIEVLDARAKVIELAHQVTAGQAKPQVLADCAAAVKAAFHDTGWRPYQVVAELARGIYLETQLEAGNSTVAETMAEYRRILELSAAFPEWPDFIWQSISGALRAVPYPEAKMILRKYLRPNLSPEMLAQLPFSNIFFAMLACACNSGEATNILDVQLLFGRLLQGTTRIEELVWIKMAAAIWEYAMGQVEESEGHMATLLDTYDALWENGASRNARNYRDFWAGAKMVLDDAQQRR